MLEIYAHRGASADEHENTLVAFEAAVRAEADGVELDVRRCQSGELIVHHDAVLADGTPLASIAYPNLPSYIPLLSEALLACGSLTVNVEIKNLPNDPDFDVDNLIVADVIRVINETNYASQVIVSSFNLATLNEVKVQFPELRTAWLIFPGMGDDLVQRTHDAGHEGVHPHFSMVDAAFVGKAREHNLFTNVWTVDEPSEMLRLADLGVDGIITNKPGSARAVLTERGE